jgi:hypothetical protein
MQFCFCMYKVEKKLHRSDTYVSYVVFAVLQCIKLAKKYSLLQRLRRYMNFQHDGFHQADSTAREGRLKDEEDKQWQKGRENEMKKNIEVFFE